MLRGWSEITPILHVCSEHVFNSTRYASMMCRQEMFVSFILLYPIHGILSGPVAILVAVPGQVSRHTLISYHDHLTWAARMDARVCKWWYARDHRLLRHSIPYIFVGSEPWAMQVDSVVYIYRYIYDGMSMDGRLAGIRKHLSRDFGRQVLHARYIVFEL